ncbi:F-box protein skip16 [Linderina pennispora]|nr:F-box protein skip16 [Linderina pennispora]
MGLPSEVCTEWWLLADDDLVWSDLLQHSCVDIEAERDYMSHKLPEIGKNKAIFASWYRRYKDFADSYTRMRRAMNKLKVWASINCPPLLQSLSPGLGWMGSESIPVRELLSVTSDSPEMRDFIIAYHLHDGQRRRMRRFDRYGLFGTYECYGDFCSVVWLPSRMLQVMELGLFKVAVFALCPETLNYLGIVVQCPDEFSRQTLNHVVEMQPGTYRYRDKGLFGDFFTSYIDQLVEGHYDIYDNMISLMPNRGPFTSTSIVRGIKTTVSAMFCAHPVRSQRLYRYQVTFELVSAEALGYPSAQLKSRSWLIRYANDQFTQTGGDGVIGKHPLLSEKEPYFKYCSLLQDELDHEMLVAFEGDFTMVPGSLANPLGPQFTLPVTHVEVPIPNEFF